MNKMKLIMPIAASLLLVGCGPKAKTVKTIWGNRWGYINSSSLGYRIDDLNNLKTNFDKVDWNRTIIQCNGLHDENFRKEDRTVERLTSSELLRNGEYSGLKRNREWFANHEFVFSSKEEKTVTVGKGNDKKVYNDARDENNDVIFNSGKTRFSPGFATEDQTIESMTVDHVVNDLEEYCNKVNYLIYINGQAEPIIATGYLDIVAY